MEGIGDSNATPSVQPGGDDESPRRRHRHHHKHRHHHRHAAAAAAPPPAPVDDIEDMVPMEEWGLLEGGRLGAAATTIGFSSQPTSTRPVGVVIPRFVGRKRPRGGVRGKEADGVEEEGEQGVSTTADASSLLDNGQEALPTAQQQQQQPQRKEHKEEEEEEDRELVAAPLPGKQRIWVRTFGCSHNVSDSEYMEGMLAEYGYDLVPPTERDEADLWLLNSCTVKNPSELSVVNLVAKAKEQGKAVVVAGCVPQGDRRMAALAEEVSLLGVTQLPRVVEVVEQTLAGHTVRLLSKAPLPQLDLPKVRRNPYVEIIPLSTGCLGACTYCKTRHARGKLGSYAIEAIVARATAVLQEGVTELWLSSEDTGAYGRDLYSATDTTDTRPGLTRLLDALLPVLPPGAMLRLGMTNPPFILDQLAAVASAMRHPNVFSFLHVPVQSGSDKVLSAMNREYTVAEFRRVVGFLQEHVPGVTIATDIICGFPGETEEDFEETLALVAEYRFPVVNISQFYPRPGTPAAKMAKVPTRAVKDRSRRMTRLFEEFRPYAGMEGSEVDVWINSEVSQDGRNTVGHTKAYVKVLLPRDPALVGTQARVRLLSTARFHVVGEVLSFRPVHPHLYRSPSSSAEEEGEVEVKAKAMARAKARKFTGEEGNGRLRGRVAVAVVEEEEEGTGEGDGSAGDGGEEEAEEEEELQQEERQAQAPPAMRRSLSSSALPAAARSEAQQPLPPVACTVGGSGSAGHTPILACALAKKPGGCSACLASHSTAAAPAPQDDAKGDCSCSSSSSSSSASSSSRNSASLTPASSSSVAAAASSSLGPNTQEEREAGGGSSSWRQRRRTREAGGGGEMASTMTTRRRRTRDKGGKAAGVVRWARSELASPSFWALALLLFMIFSWLAACAGLW